MLSLALLAFASCSHAATYTVTTTADSGTGSLRQAILNANAAGGSNAIVFSVTGTVTLNSGLAITGNNLIIMGPGTNLVTISGNNAVQVLTVSAPATARLSGLTIANGKAGTNGNGGGIYNLGVLTIADCRLVNNRTVGGWGGGIYNAGTIVAERSTLSINSAVGQNGFMSYNLVAAEGGAGAGLGGGIFNDGTLLSTNCTFAQNAATGGNGLDADYYQTGYAVHSSYGGGLNGASPGGNGGFGGGGGGGVSTTAPNWIGAGNNGGAGGFGGGGGGGGAGCYSPNSAGGNGGFGGGNGGAGGIGGTVIIGAGGGGGGIGGGIFVNSGTVWLVSCLFLNNQALGGQGGAAYPPGCTACGISAGSSGSGIGADMYNLAGSVTFGSIPTITKQPQNQIDAAGNAINFSVMVDGTPPLSYQWQYNGTNLNDGGSVFGSKADTLMLEPITAREVGSYSVVVANPFGTVTSSVATLTLTIGAYIDGQFVSVTNVVRRGPVTITLQSSFANGSIGYSLDGSDPRTRSTFYTGPFAVRKSGVLRAVAYNSTFTGSVEMDAVQITIFPTLTAIIAGGGTVKIDPPTGPYFSDSTAQITAEATPGFTFLQWLGDASGTSSTTTVTMSRDKCVEAVFGAAVGTIVVGGGSVLADPSLPLYPFGTTIRFTAQPQTGNSFTHWGAAASGTNNPLGFVVSAAATNVAAIFSPLGGGKYALTLIVNGRGHAATSPQANAYTSEQSVTLTATPEQGQAFIGWSGAASGTQNPLVVTMNQSKLITADFSERPRLRVGTPLEGLVENGFRLTLMGEFGTPYSILWSTNFLNWTAAGTVTNTYGTVQFTDPAVTNLPARFYRALSLGQ